MAQIANEKELLMLELENGKSTILTDEKIEKIKKLSGTSWDVIGQGMMLRSSRPLVVFEGKTDVMYFTPYHVCQMMADISMNDTLKDQIDMKGYITLSDPCCGAGATIIAGVNTVKKLLEKEHLNFQNYVLVSAQDIDELVALMCYLQISLLGVAGYVKVGNSLTDPITDGDSLENYWFTPMYFSDFCWGG